MTRACFLLHYTCCLWEQTMSCVQVACPQAGQSPSSARSACHKGSHTVGLFLENSTVFSTPPRFSTHPPESPSAAPGPLALKNSNQLQNTSRKRAHRTLGTLSGRCASSARQVRLQQVLLNCSRTFLSGVFARGAPHQHDGVWHKWPLSAGEAWRQVCGSILGLGEIGSLPHTARSEASALPPAHTMRS